MESVEEKIFVTEDERRDWGKRIERATRLRQPSPLVTRRYLVMAKNPEIRTVICSEFRTVPYKLGIEDIFYCIAGPSSRRKKDFIKSLMHFLQKNLEPELCQDIEIFEGVNATKELMESVG